MNKRLERFLAAENISQAKFADTINVARASVSHILSGRNKPGFDFIESMAAEYPNLDVEWLITGRGKMYKNTTVDTPKQENHSSNTPLNAPNSTESVRDVDRNSNIANTESLETPSLFSSNFSSGFSAPISNNDQEQDLRQESGHFHVQNPGQESGSGKKFNQRNNYGQYKDSEDRFTSRDSFGDNPTANKHIVKIIAFYNDGSFKELK